jgi:hypothetical protein
MKVTISCRATYGDTSECSNVQWCGKEKPMQGTYEIFPYIGKIIHEGVHPVDPVERAEYNLVD